MILDNEISSIKTGWREIIEKWKTVNPKKWEAINKLFDAETINNNNAIFPKKCSIFRCFDYFEPCETRVVILGQDPYHGKEQAIGLCFGICQDHKLPPSLRNMNNELMRDVGTNITDCRDLVHWAEQGILMMNASMTVLEKCPGSHMKVWKDFTKYIIEHINKHCDRVVFVAWGAFAHKKMEHIDMGKHELIVSSHPSPLSFKRSYKNHQCFYNSSPFSRINKHLTKKILW